MNLQPFDNTDLDNFVLANKRWAEYHKEYQSLGISARNNLWIAPQDLNALVSAGGAATLSVNGEIVAQVGSGGGCCGETVTASGESFLIEYIWHLLKVNEQIVAALPRPVLKGEVHDLAVIEGTVSIGKGTRILPGVYIEGNAVIGENCKIGPNCYIRGNTSIGDSCHIGQSVEIKNCIIGNKTNVGHLSYVGDSILGHEVNLGAGTTTSNLRHDGSNHKSEISGELVDTGRRKFGSVIANGVHTGIHTSLYPGRKLGKGVTTLPGEVITIDK